MITKIGGRRVMIARDVVLKMLVNGNRDITVQYDRLDGETGNGRAMRRSWMRIFLRSRTAGI